MLACQFCGAETDQSIVDRPARKITRNGQTVGYVSQRTVPCCRRCRPHVKSRPATARRYYEKALTKWHGRDQRPLF